MNDAQSQSGRSRGAFLLDTTVARAERESGTGADFGALRHQWEAQVGDSFPLPGLSPATTGDFRVSSRIARVHDVTLLGLKAASAIQNEGTVRDSSEDAVGLFAVFRGAWTFRSPRGQGERTISTGQFVLRRAGRMPCAGTIPHTTAEVVNLPAVLQPLLGDRVITGSVDAAEMRLLMAHANMIHETVTSLSPAGVHAASSTMIELARAVAMGRFDDAEPVLAPVLARAAKDLADRRLTDRELSLRCWRASSASPGVRCKERSRRRENR